MGSPRKPIALHRLAGSWRKDRHAPPRLSSVVVSDAFDTNPPGDLDEFGQAAWEETIAIFQRQQMLNIAFRPAVIDYCLKVQELAKHRATIAEQGELITLPNGIQTGHAACKLRDRCERAINEFRKAFGLTAASCASIGIEPPKPMSALQRFKQGEPVIASNPYRKPATNNGEPWRVVSLEEWNELVERVYLSPELTQADRDEAYKFWSECIDPRPTANPKPQAG